jgi:hypothetical protein
MHWKHTVYSLDPGSWCHHRKDLLSSRSKWRMDMYDTIQSLGVTETRQVICTVIDKRRACHVQNHRLRIRSTFIKTYLTNKVIIIMDKVREKWMKFLCRQETSTPLSICTPCVHTVSSFIATSARPSICKTPITSSSFSSMVDHLLPLAPCLRVGRSWVGRRHRAGLCLTIGRLPRVSPCLTSCCWF